MKYRLFYLLLLLPLINLLCSQVNEPGEPADNDDIKEALQDFISDKDIKNAPAGFFALNLTTGNVVAEHNSDLSIVPASVLKVLTTAAALEAFGEEHRFSTLLQYSGYTDASGTLNGNVYIKGGGDPTLGSSLFKSPGAFMERWVAAIRAAGIKKINGAVISDASLFTNEVPLSWTWGDIGNYFGATAQAVSVFDNFFEVEFSTGKSGEKAVIKNVKPEIPGLSIKSEVLSSSSETGDNTFILGAPFSNERLITGTLPANRTSFKIKGAIPDPALLAAYLLQEELKKAEIAVMQPARVGGSNESKAERKPLDTLYSPPLRDIVYFTNLKSINTYAETLLRHFSLVRSGKGDLTSATAALKSFWKEKGIDVAGMFIEDGSGLSRANGITARQLTMVLKYMKEHSANFDAFYNSLPIAGRTGSLANIGRGTAAEGNLRAKSGYMTRVRSYCGYVTNKRNELIAFAFIINNYDTSPAQARQKMEKVMARLAG